MRLLLFSRVPAPQRVCRNNHIMTAPACGQWSPDCFSATLRPRNCRDSPAPPHCRKRQSSACRPPACPSRPEDRRLSASGRSAFPSGRKRSAGRLRSCRRSGRGSGRIPAPAPRRFPWAETVGRTGRFLPPGSVRFMWGKLPTGALASANRRKAQQKSLRKPSQAPACRQSGKATLSTLHFPLSAKLTAAKNARNGFGAGRNRPARSA